MPGKGEVDYTRVLELDLETIVPSVAGPKRPQDRIPLPELKNTFINLLQQEVKSGGYGKPYNEINVRYAADIGASEHALAMVVGGGEQHPTTAPLPADGHITTKDTSAWTETEMMNNRPTPDRVEKAPDKPLAKGSLDLGHGDVLIAAITSCTNTSNPSVMLAAGLLASTPLSVSRFHSAKVGRFLECLIRAERFDRARVAVAQRQGVPFACLCG